MMPEWTVKIVKPLLECKNVSKYFGDFAAVKNLSFEVFPGETYGIAGPNGAGKTTLFNIITGIPIHATSGHILFKNKEIQKLKGYQICHRGLARTFQIPNIIEGFSYLENVLLGSAFTKPTHAKSPRERAVEALTMVGLPEKKNMLARGSSLYDRKRLMLASALAANPESILLDEPVGGLNKLEIANLTTLFTELKTENITLIIIEHVMTTLMVISDRVMILQQGEKICEGSPEEVSCDPAVIEAYLGEDSSQLGVVI